MAVIKNTGESRRERTPLPWDEKCVALEDAIRRLPIAPVQDPQAMAYSDLIPGIARDLMLMSPIGPPAGYARKPAATATAKRELRDLSANAKALGDVIDRLSKTAHDALNFRP